jgi:hypothetical protein
MKRVDNLPPISKKLSLPSKLNKLVLSKQHNLPPISKKAQQTMSMPFGLIFSIFLIVIFIAVAFYAVKFFLNISESSKIGTFYLDLQDDVNKAWSSQSSEFNFKIKLPSKIEKVCFANLSAKITGSMEDYNQIKNYEVYEANTFILPPEYAKNMQWKMIHNLNLTKITSLRNPYCVPVDKGLRIKKDFYDRAVTIE